MLNARGTLWSILGILFIFSIVSAAFAQQERQPDTVPTNSQQETLNQINKKLDGLDTKVDGLVTETGKLVTEISKLVTEIGKLVGKVDEIEDNILVLNTSIKYIQWGMGIIGAPLLFFTAGIFVQLLLNRKKEATVSPEAFAQAVSETTTKIISEVVTQIVPKVASEPTSEVATESRPEPHDYLRQDDFTDKTQSDSRFSQR